MEFKKAENNFDFEDLGKYFSALSNEANLRGLPFTGLVFVKDVLCSNLSSCNTPNQNLKQLGNYMNIMNLEWENRDQESFMGLKTRLDYSKGFTTIWL